MAPTPLQSDWQSDFEHIRIQDDVRSFGDQSSIDDPFTTDPDPPAYSDTFATPTTTATTTTNPAVDNPYHKIIIGVDYGTTYTGISYVPTSLDGADVNIIRTWPGPGGSAVWKVPSTIAYARENSDTISDYQDRWGYSVTPKMKSYSWTKLLLDRNNALHDYDDPELFTTQGAGCLRLPAGGYKSAADVSADFLRKVYQFTIETLEKRLSADVVKVTPFEFWFTVPAIWSDAAKNSTINAAKSAGFGSRHGDEIRLIPEPEAAAMATIKDRSVRGEMGVIKAGHNVLICDCGGGTVDITTYSVKSTKPLEFNELVIGTGAKCGSTFIDREFHKWMGVKFGRQFTQLAFDKKGPGSRFMKDFEAYKHDFGNSADLDRVYEVRLVMRGVEDSDIYDSEDSVVKIRGHDMRQFFEPAITGIKGLLVEQFNEAQARNQRIDHVILAGGFGDSNYLFREIQALCRQRGMPLPVCPENPQAAIVKGAALRGLENTGRPAKRCRKHYGFSWHCAFREGTDPESNSFIWDWDGTKRCRNRMAWQIEKRQLVTKDTHMSTSVVRVHYDGEPLTFSADLYCCGLEESPDWATSYGVQYVGQIQVTMRLSDLENFECKTIDGSKSWQLKYNIEVSMGSDDGVLRFRATYQGRELGSTAIKYVDDDEPAPATKSP